METAIKRGPGRPSKAEVAARREAMRPKRSPEEILADIQDRFTILSKLTEGVVYRNIRAVTFSGGPGTGKTTTVSRILSKAADDLGIQYEIISGTISPINLYKMSYRMRRPGNVIVVDDADKIFGNEEALNLLKAMCDSTDVRRVSYLKDAFALKEEDIPQTHDFNGSVIIISNVDFQGIVDDGKSKLSPHVEAILSRTHYLDLRLHSRDELMTWVEYVATSGGIFRKEGLTPEQGQAIVQFIRTHKDDLRELSLRTIRKASEIIQTEQDGWEKMARVTLLKH